MNPPAKGSSTGTNGGCVREEVPAQKPIFQVYLGPEAPFVDRFTQEPGAAVDVIIPVLATNDLWKKNLLSIYKEIPVKRLLLGDAGCIDKTLVIAREFPRVTVFDHRQFVSLGYSIRKLIEEVKSEWFVYLHSDVFLPEGWFEAMRRQQTNYDWFECRQHLTVLLDYPLNASKTRAYSGSQMGRTAAFQNVLPQIDDDYLYRNEDIIIAELLQKQGHRYGRAEDVCHYHQHMPKKSTWERKVHVSFQVETSRAEEIREYTMQAKGLVKYLDPTPELAHQVNECVNRLVALGETSWGTFLAWVMTTRPDWAPFLTGLGQYGHLRRVWEDGKNVARAVLRLFRSSAALALRGLQPLNPFKKRNQLTRAA